MKLTLTPRSAARKSEARQLRRSGYIPAVLYSRGRIGENVAVKNSEFEVFLRNLPKGRLPTTILTLLDSEQRERRAIVKDIQYNPVNYAIIALDFEELHDDCPVSVNVPIECTGLAECPGVKLGGFFRQVIRHARVRCLPQNLPKVFTIDISAMKIKQSRRLNEIAFPEGVRSLVDLNEVCIVIGKGKREKG